MTYSDFKVGDIILFRSRSFLGWLIRLFTGSRFNHVALVSSLNGELIINEADTDGIVYQVFPDYLDAKYIKIGRPRKEFDRNKFVERANFEIGKPYDYLNLLGEQVIKSITGVWRGDGKTDKFICSSYVAYVYELQSWEKYSPSDFDKQIEIFDFKFEGKIK